MVGNMSFYKCPNFGAVMNRFSIFKKIKRKTPIISIFFCFVFFIGVMQRNVYFHLNKFNAES